MPSKIAKTMTIRLNKDDLVVITKLQKATGIQSQVQLIRACLRSVLRKVEGEIRNGWT